jgi:formylglycine-generating enzyme required for sulfatase activity
LTTTVDSDERSGRRSDELAGRDETRSVLLEKALNHERLVIVGDPGAGKTTFLHRVAYALCKIQLKEAVPDEPFCLALGDGDFPILVKLPNLLRCIRELHDVPGGPTNDESPAWLPYYLAEVNRNAWGLDHDFFRKQLETGHCRVLLDGLDEAPDRAARETLARVIEHATEDYSQCRFVVTSRPSAYTDGAVLRGFSCAIIDPLSDDAAQALLGRWYDALFTDDKVGASQPRDELLQVIELRPDIRDTIRNPVMLTALAVVHWNERQLPEQRAELFESIVTWLSRSREQRPGRPTAKRSVALLGKLALAMQDHPEGRQTEVSRTWAAEAIANNFTSTQDPGEAASTFLLEEEIDSGIVAGRGENIRFWHLTFQEYLAAKTVSGLRENKQIRLLLGRKAPKKLYRPEWREVVLLLAGILFGPDADRVDGLVEAMLDDLLDPATPGGQQSQLADQAQCAGLLGAIVRDLAPYRYRPADPRYDRLMKNVMAIFDTEGSRTVPVETRVAAAEALGRARDPRPGVDLRTDRPGLPDIVWCDVPKGILMMGSASDDEEAYEEEYGPAGSPFPVEVQAFRLAAYPVTCAQFRPFVESDGYQNRLYWPQSGWTWKEEYSITSPRFWDDGRWNVSNYPVIGVSWYEAVAWCRWLTRRLRDIGELSKDKEIRLPTEAEWEWAGRGPEAHKYPSGSEWTDGTANNAAVGINRTCSVGLFPAGASRWLSESVGVTCHDLSGNVWEWTVTKWRDSYTERPDDSLEGKEPRTLRGGSYLSLPQDTRCTRRYRSYPGDCDNNGGFRCAK